MIFIKRCPSCMAQIDFNGKRKTKCEYCGSTVYEDNKEENNKNIEVVCFYRNELCFNYVAIIEFEIQGEKIKDKIYFEIDRDNKIIITKYPKELNCEEIIKQIYLKSNYIQKIK